MNENKDKKNESSCVDACDREFISCVESSQVDCLHRFRRCSSACST